MKTDVISPPIFLEDISEQPRIRLINHLMKHELFLENLSRPDDCQREKVTVPDYASEFIKNKALPEYRFPWGTRDIVVGRHWAMVSPHFSTSILAGIMPDYFSNGNMYHVPWIVVEKVYFLVHEPKKHWCLAELEIRNGVVTFYDSLGWAGGNRRRWWRQMKKYLPKKLTLYLHMHGVLESKGISAGSYNITYKYADAPFQAALFGDRGIWVCIFLYRLCRNLPLTVDDPLQTALACRKRMLEYFWNHKIQIESTLSVVEGI
ncbi:phospholipase-like protein [Tanacetum coccineum]